MQFTFTNNIKKNAPIGLPFDSHRGVEFRVLGRKKLIVVCLVASDGEIRPYELTPKPRTERVFA